MKAARLHAFNAALELDELPAPDVTDPFDVIVRVGGAGFCRTDLHIIEGWFDGVIPTSAPRAAGSSASPASGRPARSGSGRCAG